MTGLGLRSKARRELVRCQAEGREHDLPAQTAAHRGQPERDRHRPLEALGERAQTRTQHQSHPGRKRSLGLDECDRLVDLFWPTAAPGAGRTGGPSLTC